MLLDEIKKANMQALKNHDELTHSVLPMVMAKALERKVELRAKKQELSDADVIMAIRKLSAEYDEAIADFTMAGRLETVAQLKKKKEVLAAYLPQLMSEEEIRQEIAGLPDKSIASVMKHFKTECAGKADLRVVARLAQEK